MKSRHAGCSPKLPLKTTFTDYRVTARGLVTEERWQRSRGGRAEVHADRSGSETVTRAEIEAFAERLPKVG